MCHARFFINVHFPVPDDALNSVLRALGEMRYIFPDDETVFGAHPYIYEDWLHVRGKKVVSVAGLDRVGCLALWGASFTVFAEKITKLRCKNTATLMACVVLKTDKLLHVKACPTLSSLLKDLGW